MKLFLIRRMKRSIFLILFLILSIVLNASVVYGEVIFLKEILDRPDVYDRQEVKIEGEAIGEVLKADKGAWINIASGSYNIGVFSPNASIFRQISYWGSYKERGDRLRIKGIFYKNCPLRQISYIDLKTLEIIEKGVKIKALVPFLKIKLAFVLFAICLMTAYIYFRKRKYGREI